jgi:hypothetical protein
MGKKFRLSDSGIQKGVILLLAFLALWAGAMVYIHMRHSNPLLVHWIEFAGLGKIFSLNHRIALYLPIWLVYSLPSGFWAFSYAILITGLWWNSNSSLKYLWLLSTIFMAVGWELLQLAGWIFGTFSMGDILAGIMGASAGIWVGTRIIKPKYYEKKCV